MFSFPNELGIFRKEKTLSIIDFASRERFVEAPTHSRPALHIKQLNRLTDSESRKDCTLTRVKNSQKVDTLNILSACSRFVRSQAEISVLSVPGGSTSVYH